MSSSKEKFAIPNMKLLHEINEDDEILPLTRVMSLTDKKSTRIVDTERHGCKRSSSDSHLMKNLHVKKSIEFTKQLKRMQEKFKQNSRQLSVYGSNLLEEKTCGSKRNGRCLYTLSNGRKYLESYMNEQTENIKRIELLVKNDKKTTENDCFKMKEKSLCCDKTMKEFRAAKLARTYSSTGRQVAVVRPIQRQPQVKTEEPAPEKSSKVEANDTTTKENSITTTSVKVIFRKPVTSSVTINANNSTVVKNKRTLQRQEHIKKRYEHTLNTINEIDRLMKQINTSAFNKLTEKRRNSALLQPKYVCFEC